MVSLDADSVDNLVTGLILGENLEIPTEVSMISHVKALFAPQDELRQFTQMRFAWNVGFQATNNGYGLYFSYSLQVCNSKAVTIY